MKTNFSKRLGAYLIDILLLSILLAFVTILFQNNQKEKELDIKLNNLTEQYLSNEITNISFYKEYASISYDNDHKDVLYNIINVIFIILYFIILPYYNNGQTIGKKILKIKIVKEDGELTINDLIIRNLIINGLLQLLISLAIVYILPSWPYFIVNTIIGLLQSIFIIIIVIGLITKKDKLILHDRLAHTKVIDAK